MTHNNYQEILRVNKFIHSFIDNPFHAHMYICDIWFPITFQNPLLLVETWGNS